MSICLCSLIFGKLADLALTVQMALIISVGHLFLRATNFVNGTKKGVAGNYFHE